MAVVLAGPCRPVHTTVNLETPLVLLLLRCTSQTWDGSCCHSEEPHQCHLTKLSEALSTFASPVPNSSFFQSLPEFLLFLEKNQRLKESFWTPWKKKLAQWCVWCACGGQGVRGVGMGFPTYLQCLLPSLHPQRREEPCNINPVDFVTVPIQVGQWRWQRMESHVTGLLFTCLVNFVHPPKFKLSRNQKRRWRADRVAQWLRAGLGRRSDPICEGQWHCPQ